MFSTFRAAQHLSRCTRPIIAGRAMTTGLPPTTPIGTPPAPVASPSSSRPSGGATAMLQGITQSLPAASKEEGDDSEARKIWALFSERAEIHARQPHTPYSGRTLMVKPVPGGFSQAYNALRTLLTKDRIQQELYRNLRHEKKGYKRRRLQSERWRRLLADQVRKKVQLVQAILRRGA